MYLPKHFEETRVERLHGLIEAHPFGTLVTGTAGGLEANHLPFEIDPEPRPFGTLRGHLARANPHWKTFTPDADALVVFHGPDAYVSPALLPTKQENGKVVPTWNYAVVHAYGPARAIDDRDWLRAFVERLTERHERARRDPWRVGDAPDDFIETMLRGIVGIEIPIRRLVGKWKLSQNRPDVDRAGVVAGLPSETATPASVADLMRESLETAAD